MSAAASAEIAVTAASFPKILVCLLLHCAAGQSIRMFVTKHPSRCSPSFVVVVVIVVVVIAATISDQHVVTIRGFCVPAMVS